ncbi:hypothetical protein [Stieleria varia]|uniref:Uncharacterized protein n=1 Tax=Stieleria varia TaxID=2528005 RepID=A0A5C6A3Y9_9BACT|nr:hypothetical protein [Stieleria varia]TWT94614.1 hypothetical protein Pla52n_54350 [Stieleria varia]
MRWFPWVLMLAITGFFAGVASAQLADPFGGGGSDPFGGGETAAADPGTTSPNQSATQKPAGAQAGKRKPAEAKNKSSAAIRAALNEDTSNTFIETPLIEALQVLGDLHDIPIVLDRRSLEEIGLSADAPVTIDLKSVSLRSFLRLMLRDLQLTYLVKDDVLQIMTTESAAHSLTTEVYPFSKELSDKGDKIMKALTTTVNPSTWEALGGPSSVAVIDNVLVVSATERTHEEVIEFLKKLQEAFENHKASR